jgi:hypothetical protein
MSVAWKLKAMIVPSSEMDGSPALGAFPLVRRTTGQVATSAGRGRRRRRVSACPGGRNPVVSDANATVVPSPNRPAPQCPHSTSAPMPTGQRAGGRVGDGEGGPVFE